MIVQENEDNSAKVFISVCPCLSALNIMGMNPSVKYLEAGVI